MATADGEEGRENPTSIGAIEFNSTTGDVQYLVFDAMFRFTEFEII